MIAIFDNLFFKFIFTFSFVFFHSNDATIVNNLDNNLGNLVGHPGSIKMIEDLIYPNNRLRKGSTFLRVRRSPRKSVKNKNTFSELAPSPFLAKPCPDSQYISGDPSEPGILSIEESYPPLDVRPGWNDKSKNPSSKYKGPSSFNSPYSEYQLILTTQPPDEEESFEEEEEDMDEDEDGVPEEDEEEEEYVEEQLDRSINENKQVPNSKLHKHLKRENGLKIEPYFNRRKDFGSSADNSKYNHPFEHDQIIGNYVRQNKFKKMVSNINSKNL